MKILKYIIVLSVIAWAMTWIRYHPILQVLALVAFAGYLVVLVITSAFGIGAARKKLMPRLAIAVFMVLWGCWLYFDHEYRWSDIAAIKIETKKYEACKSSGIPFDGNRLSVCAVNEEWWRFEFTEAIIYDSSGQILRQHGPHTRGWINAALKLKGVPFGNVGFESRHLTGDFYLVTFNDVLGDDLISECVNIHDQCVLRQK